MNKYIIIQETNFNKLKSFIKNARQEKKLVIFSSNDDSLNRQVLEKANIDILLLNQKNRKDFQKQRDSGFNQVMAKTAKKRGVSIGINLDELTTNACGAKLLILARVQQNIKLCKKYKLKMKFISEKNKKDIYDLKALGLVLGMPTWMTKELD